MRANVVDAGERMPPPSRLVAHTSAGDKCSVRPAVSLPHLTSMSTSGLSSTVITSLNESGDIPLRLALFLSGHSDSTRRCRCRVPGAGVHNPVGVPYEGCRGAGECTNTRQARPRGAMSRVTPRFHFALIGLGCHFLDPPSRRRHVRDFSGGERNDGGRPVCTGESRPPP